VLLVPAPVVGLVRAFHGQVLPGLLQGRALIGPHRQPACMTPVHDKGQTCPAYATAGNTHDPHLVLYTYDTAREVRHAGGPHICPRDLWTIGCNALVIPLASAPRRSPDHFPRESPTLTFHKCYPHCGELCVP
jgi:hypothetical protein